MKIVLTICLYFIATMAYEDLNDQYVEVVLNDDQLLRQLYGCLVDVSPCDDFGTHSKGHIAQILTDGCNECDWTQKHLTHRYIMKLKANFPDLYEKFEVKYDPTRKLLKKLDEEMTKF